MTQNQVIIYQTDDGKISVNVKMTGDTVWLSLQELSVLFKRDKSVISRHLSNIFKDEELNKEAVVAKFATTANDSKIYQVEHYNLDAIISLGYRVNSKRGIQFRKWASNVLKEYLIQGYSINYSQASNHLLNQLQETIDLLSKTLMNQSLTNDLGNETLQIIIQYSRTWKILLQYDEDTLSNNIKSNTNLIYLQYHDAKIAIKSLKQELIKKNEASELFGKERDKGLESLLANLAQTFDYLALYNSNIEVAANLLYLVIKNHPFIDGNKRIGCLLFLLYTNMTNLNLKLNDNGLIALALLIAESNPNQKTLMINLIITLFNN